MSTYHTPMWRPNVNDPTSWRTYWQANGQSWRTEPEITLKRQKYLSECLLDAKFDTYRQGHPFKNIVLCRADVEWLLALNDDVHRPIDLWGADLRKVDLYCLPLEEADFSEARLEGANLVGTHLERADLNRANLQRAVLSGGHLEGAFLTQAHLEKANLNGAHLETASLSQAHLEGASLCEAHLEGANLNGTHLEGSDLRGAFLTSATNLRDILFGDKQTGFVSLAGVYWSDADLTTIDWTRLNILGDEQQAKQRFMSKGEVKDSNVRLDEYRTAVRANRQLAVALREQGLNEEAAYFAYRAYKLQRVVLRRQRKFGPYILSLFLDLLAGYGYRLGRSLIAYLIVIFGFMGLYLVNAHVATPHLKWDEALVLSLSSFHGRGFFSQNITLGDTYARLAAAEAIVGLLIEVNLIATFTQRFFGK